MKKHLLFIFALLMTATLTNAQCTADFTYTVSAAGTLSVTAIGTGSGTPGYVGNGEIVRLHQVDKQRLMLIPLVAPIPFV